MVALEVEELTGTLYSLLKSMAAQIAAFDNTRAFILHLHFA